MKRIFGEYGIYLAVGLTIALIIHLTKSFITWTAINLSIFFGVILAVLIIITISKSRRYS